MATWLSLDELAAYLKLPKSTMYKLVQRGVIRGSKLGKVWRFDREDVDSQIKALGKKASGSVLSRDAEDEHHTAS